MGITCMIILVCCGVIQTNVGRVYRGSVWASSITQGIKRFHLFTVIWFIFMQKIFVIKMFMQKYFHMIYILS